MQAQTKATWKIYWRFIRQNGGSMTIVLLLLVAANIVNLMPPIYFKKLFDAIAVEADLSVMVPILMMVALLYGIDWILWHVVRFILNVVQPKMMAQIEQFCFSYLHRHSIEFFQNNFVGSLVKRVNRFVQAFERTMDRFLWNILQIVIGSAVMVVVLWQRNIWLPVIMLVWMALYGLMNFLLIRKKLPYDIKRSELESKTTGFLADTISNQSAVKFYNGYGREIDSFKGMLEKVRQAKTKSYNLDTWFEGGQTVLMYGLEIGMMYGALLLWQRGLLTIGDFALIQSYLLTLFLRIWDLGKIIRGIYEDMADAKEMTEILETPLDICDAPGAKPLVVAGGEVTFDEVDFAYHSTRTVLKNFSCTIKPGERVALVGPSGAGKSTIIKILLRLYEVTAGKILIDGKDIKRVTLESLWQAVSYVSQEPLLFHRSIKENIRYGKPDATDKEVIRAAKLAHCHEFIEDLQNGYDTMVGERGVKLSGGERQRVAIARAMLRNSPILLLDEATSSLDSESEYLIQDALENVMKGKTVVAVAHRLSTIMHMDRIIVLKDGEIVEEGPHTELLQKPNGVYQGLWSLQVGGFLGYNGEE